MLKSSIRGWSKLNQCTNFRTIFCASYIFSCLLYFSSLESSRCDTSSPPFCPWIVNKNRPSDLNIFDNPEAFESLSTTPSPTTPTAEEFFKTLGNKISRNSSFLSENVSQDELQLRNSSNLVTSDLQADKVVRLGDCVKFCANRECCRLLAIWTPPVKNLSVHYT